MTKKYEYRIFESLVNKWGSFNIEENETMLTSLGLEGWKLVNTHYIGTKICFFLEREIEPVITD